MPLHDHFHPPLSDECAWDTLHSNWATKISDRLNECLPERFISREHTHIGTQVEINVAAFEMSRNGADHASTNGQGAIATAIECYAPPLAPLSAEVEFLDADLFEIQVFYQSGGYQLVAAIELVSRANKDRPAHRRSFVTKCASYLARGISVVVIDAVTDRQANLHAELVDLMKLPESLRWQPATNLSAIAYRVFESEKKVCMDVWPFELALGIELPTVPLWIATNLAIPLELEATYTAACRGLRLRS